MGRFFRFELDNIGKQLSRIWHEMSGALAAHDIKRAVNYYHVMVREDWQKQYAAYSKKDLKKIAKEMLGDQIS